MIRAGRDVGTGARAVARARARLIFEVPSNLLLLRFGARLWIGGS